MALILGRVMVIKWTLNKVKEAIKDIYGDVVLIEIVCNLNVVL